GLAHGDSQHGYERCREAARGYREPGLHDVDPPRNGAHVRSALRRHTLLRYATARTFLRHQPDRPTLPYPAAAATPATATASWTTPGRRRRRLSRYLRRRSPPSRYRNAFITMRRMGRDHGERHAFEPERPLLPTGARSPDGGSGEGGVARGHGRQALLRRLLRRGGLFDRPRRRTDPSRHGRPGESRRVRVPHAVREPSGHRPGACPGGPAQSRTRTGLLRLGRV